MSVSCTFTTTSTPFSGGSTTTTTTYDADVTLALYAKSPGTTNLLLPGKGVVTQPLSRLSLKTVPATTSPSSMSWWRSDFSNCSQTYGFCPPRGSRETTRTLAEYKTSGKELDDEVTVTIKDVSNDSLLDYLVRARTLSVKATTDGGLSLAFQSHAYARGLSTTSTSYNYKTTCNGTWHP